MKLFSECLKDAGVKSGHVVTALGNNSYKFGRNRSQPKRDKKRLDANHAMAETTESKAWNIPLDIKKYEPDQKLIFGWASVVEKDGKLIVDKQGDVIPVKELENAAYEFTLNSRNGGDMHSRYNVSKLVESMVFTRDKQEALGINLGQVGWWVGFKVHDEELWSAHKRGDRPEFSIGGAAVPIEVIE